ncbi:MAG: molybdopterin molybdotransferase MoeA [Candidatus Krumholzibacteriota bacterium]|nr:molybdopterin molybdotransferase MoeA [Candidatus Krumholzibacteriota bacterium]
MISFEKALEIVTGSAGLIEREDIPLIESTGRVLAEDIYSDIDMPPFDKSAMDGFACRREDIDSGRLKIIETVPAGKIPKKTVGKGECSRIMTGGVVPQGADNVVMVENTEEDDGFVTVTSITSERNVCHKGEDLKAGDPVMRRGTVIGSSKIALLASVGIDPVPVFRRPVLGIVATGSELVEPHEKPEGAMIRNSNGYQLCSQAAAAGFDPRYLGIAGDTPDAVGRIIDERAEGIDIFIFSGGVSMGEYDFVPGVLKEKGFDLFFEKVAVKPGKPMVFGKKGNCWVFGLPGNPVSTFILFELFVKPFCFRMMETDYIHREAVATVSKKISRKKTGRRSHLPVRYSGPGEVSMVEYHGSAHIGAIAEADGFIAIPESVSGFEAGDRVKVILFS